MTRCSLLRGSTPPKKNHIASERPLRVKRRERRGKGLGRELGCRRAYCSSLDTISLSPNVESHRCMSNQSNGPTAKATGRTGLFFQPASWVAIALVGTASVVTQGQPSAPDKRARAALGKALFFDTALSADGKVACATCHRPDIAFADREGVARGTFGRRGTRNAPSLLGVGTAGLFWDGRRASLEELVLDPLTTPEEHGFADISTVLGAVRARHEAGFARVFPGEGVTERTVAFALSAYVRSLVPEPSPFERYLAGEPEALSPAQRRGLALFTGRAGCARCHRIEGSTLADDTYHPGEVAPELASRLASAAQESSRMSPGERRAAVPARVEMAALGRYVATLRPTDIGRFRTPSLRNVALTAPYMHDGSVPTLTEAVVRELYYRAGDGLQIGDLTPAERADLIDFLQALTSLELQPDAPATAAAVRSPSSIRSSP